MSIKSVMQYSIYYTLHKKSKNFCKICLKQIYKSTCTQFAQQNIIE